MRTLCGSLMLLCLPFLAVAQGNDGMESEPATVASPGAGSASEVVFAFEPAGMGKPYEIKVEQDGHGSLRYLGDGQEPSRELVVGEQTLSLLTKPVATVSSGTCETHQKHVANTGRKTLSYALDAGTASCSFNFSDDRDVNAAASTFLAIQETVEMGAELARLHRYDRLGLDAEMEALQKAVQTHYAVEVENIAPVLESIANDDRVMQRVRRRASQLLEDAGVKTVASSSVGQGVSSVSAR